MTDNQIELPQLADLLDVLDLAELGTAQISVTGLHGQDAAAAIGATSARVFEGKSQKQAHGRVFGGQVLAQCVIAAGRTVGDVDGTGPRPIHSLHGYFMRPGDDTLPIRFAVEEMRDGRSFSTRRVHAIQKGAPIMSLNASFQKRSGGVDHQIPMPSVPDPEELRTLADILQAMEAPTAEAVIRQRPIEHRPVEMSAYFASDAEPVPEQHIWMRAVGALPDDPLLHAAVLTYCSDYSLLEPVLQRHRLTWGDPNLRVASLDHSMWFHREARLDEWLLYTLSSPSAESGRGLGIGHMFRRDGTLVATVAQEGMIRVKSS